MWYQPRCPVSAEEKAWIERRMVWLSEQFGRERLLQAPVILPTVEYFPDPYNGSEGDARLVMERVCRYMGLDPGCVEFGFYSLEQLPDLWERFPTMGYCKGTAGLYSTGERPGMWIEAARVEDPLALVATLAHVLGHVRLIGEGRISKDEPDHEPLTDLLTVYFGFGVIQANSYLREERWEGIRPSGARYTAWSLSRLGYLLAPAYGYALALFAWARGETKPAWARELRLDARHPFQQGLRYLQKTRDSVFKPEPGG